MLCSLDSWVFFLCRILEYLYKRRSRQTSSLALCHRSLWVTQRLNSWIGLFRRVSSSTRQMMLFHLTSSRVAQTSIWESRLASSSDLDAYAHHVAIVAERNVTWRTTSRINSQWQFHKIVFLVLTVASSFCHSSHLHVSLFSLSEAACFAPKTHMAAPAEMSMPYNAKTSKKFVNSY